MRGPFANNRTWRATPISGKRRLSPGSGSYLPYSDTGVSAFENNVTFTNAHLQGRWSGGGAFSVHREANYWDPSPLYANDNLIVGGIRVEGPTVAIPTLSLMTPYSDATLNSMGTTAIALTEPTRPAFDLSVFVGELLREGIPNAPGHSIRERVNLARSSGSEYLNVEFGWLPLIRGVQDFAKTVDESDKILRKYQEQSNTIIQRDFEWPIQEQTRFDSFSLASMNPASALMQSVGPMRQRAWRRTWFEVEYQYYLPTGSSRNDKIRRFGSYARKLLGVDLSPEVLWNLAPWSWAADWVSNTGDVLHNVSAIGQDGLVIRHGYMMCHAGREKEFTASYNGSAQTRLTVLERKVRRPASPFGFGVDWDGFTPKQLAILASIGMSRLP
nr:MAG: hypothetical protein 1 [Leviviridae sp.]